MTSQNHPPEFPIGSHPIERAVQHVVQAIIVAGIIGGYYGLNNLKASNNDLKTTIAVIQVELVSLNARLTELKNAASDRYTGAQATRDLAPLFARTNDHESRIRDLEKELRDALYDRKKIPLK